jgi:hypothetical protein
MWEAWRRKITGKRPYRCQDCHWRGWAVDWGSACAEYWNFGAAEPPNLGTIGLAPEERRTGPDLEALDAIYYRDAEGK